MSSEALLLGTVLLWSFNFTATRYGVSHGFAPLAYAPLRWVLAGAALTGVARVSRGQRRLERRAAGVVIGATLIGIAANQIAFVYAVRLAPAAVVALVFGTLPVLISVVSHATGVERLAARHWVATVVSFGGVALVAAGAGSRLSGDLAAIALALTTAITFAVYSVAIVPVLRTHSPLLVNAVSAASGGIMLVLLCAPALASENWGRPTPLAWGALLYSGLASIVVGNVFWFTAIKRAGPGRAALFANLQPFLGAIFAVLVLSESLRPLQVVGGGVIALGITIAPRPRLVAPITE